MASSSGAREPHDVLQFLVNPDTHSLTFVGQTKTNRRCRNIIAMRDVSSAKIILQNLLDAARDDENSSRTLQQLAALMLCKRWHVHDQAQRDRIVAIWARQIKPSPSPTSRQPARATQTQQRPARMLDRQRYLITQPNSTPSTSIARAAQRTLPPPPDPCIICLEDLGSNGAAEALPCAHTFCRGCITTWRRQSRRCPLCRHDETQSSIRASRSSSITAQHERTAADASMLQTQHLSVPFDSVSTTALPRQNVMLLARILALRPVVVDREAPRRAQSGWAPEFQRRPTTSQLRPVRTLEASARSTTQSSESAMAGGTTQGPMASVISPTSLDRPSGRAPTNAVTTDHSSTPPSATNSLSTPVSEPLSQSQSSSASDLMFSQTASIIGSSDGSALGTPTSSASSGDEPAICRFQCFYQSSNHVVDDFDGWLVGARGVSWLMVG